RVVIAAAVGNVIEWYDFYIFGSLAALLAPKFFAQSASGSDLIKYVGTFTAGFLIRPVGAFLFGRIGDLIGRKYTFLITLSGMGVADPVPPLSAHDRDRDLYPVAAAGDADLPGDQGEGADGQESLERGVPQPEHQIRPHCERGRDRRGGRVVQRPVLGAVFPAAGPQT